MKLWKSGVALFMSTLMLAPVNQLPSFANEPIEMETTDSDVNVVEDGNEGLTVNSSNGAVNEDSNSEPVANDNSELGETTENIGDSVDAASFVTQESHALELSSDTQEIGEFDGDLLYINTGSGEYSVVPAEYAEYESMSDVFEEDGSYTIEISEGNPFFPYQVQFRIGDNTWTEWFMTPDSTVEIDGHRIGVDVWEGKYSSLTLHVGSDDVVVYPKEKEFKNSGFLLMSNSLSLMPLREIELAVDLSGYNPVELSHVSSKTVIQGIESDSTKIVWNMFESDDNYKISSYGDSLNLIGDSTQTKWEMVVGEADQLALDNIRYIVDVKTANFDNWLSVSMVAENPAGERRTIAIDDPVKFERKELISNSGNHYQNFYSMNTDSANITDDDKLFVCLGVGENFTRPAEIKVVKPSAYNTPDYDITSKIWESDLNNGGGYELTRYQSSGSAGDYIEVSTYDENGKYQGSVSFSLNLQIGDHHPEYSLYPANLSDGSNFIISSTSYNRIDNHAELSIYLKEDYPTDGQYNLGLKLIQIRESNEVGTINVDKISNAYDGDYATIEAAEEAGAPNIKDQLFGLTNPSEGYTADYSSGRMFTVFAKLGDDDTLSRFTISVTTKDNSQGSTFRGYYNTSTAVTFTGLVDRNGNSINCYCVDAELDSYGNGSYRTIMVGKDVDITDIAPTFTTKDGVSLYRKDSSNAITSGRDYRDFSNGAIQYTAGSSGRDFQTNYWLQVIKSDSNYTLFINSLGDSDSNVTIDENGVLRADREVIFTKRDVLYHDILVMNMGTAAIPKVEAVLESDTLDLDNYWTLSGNHDLSRYMESDGTDSQYGERSNIAKIRLKRKSSVSDGDSVSGTLTIKSNGAVIAVITLKGTVGDPAIITESVPDAVKYVHYATMIQNNVKYKWDDVSYSIIDGATPPGLDISRNGELYGVPEEAGTYSFTVRIDHSSEFPSSTKEFTMTVQPNTDANVEASTSEGYEVTERIPDFTSTPDRNYVFKSQGRFAEFMVRSRVTLDGDLLVLGNDYEAEEGSTVITIYAQTLGSKGNGTHTISVEFRDENDALHVAAQNYHVSGMPENSGKQDGESGNTAGSASDGRSTGDSYSEHEESDYSSDATTTHNSAAKFNRFTGTDTGVKGATNVINATVKESVQGPLAMAVFNAIMPAGFKQAMTFNLISNGALNYDRKQGILVLDISKDMVREGRTFALIGIGLNGQPKIFGDIDLSDNTVTSDIDIEGYGFALIYSDEAGAQSVVKSSDTNRVYIVQPKDTLTKIARELRTTVAYLVKKNNIADPNKIYPNQVIYY